MRIALGIEMNIGYYRGTLRGVARYARTRKGWHLNQQGPTVEGLQWLKRRNPDALIIGGSSVEILKLVASFGIPVVNVGKSFAEVLLPKVSNDEVSIGVMAAEYFFGRGYRHFGYAGHGGNIQDGRGISFEQRLKELQLHCSSFAEPAWPEDERKSEANSAAFNEWLNGLEKPAAIFCHNDHRAWMLAEQCQALGLEVPREIAILGVDNDVTVCSLSDPPLSSIQTASERIGYEAARLLESLLNGDVNTPNPPPLPPLRVVQRRSTDALYSDDEVVARALCYMQEHLLREEGVEALTKRMACSRRSFERRFLEATGSTPAHTWTKFRIAEAQRLLAETSLTIDQISQLTGFSDGNHLSTTFRKQTRLTPAQFRKRSQLARE